MRTAYGLLLLGTLPIMPAVATAAEIGWKKTTIDKAFHSEGVAIADVNRDGKMDILAGDYWYEAPEWKAHEIRKPGDFGDGAKGYSQSFACWADDINGDNWQDVIVIGFPGKPCHWYENPKGAEGHWKEHMIWKSACNETPLYVDLFGSGKRVLVMATQPEGQIAWFTPSADITQAWYSYPISEKSTKEMKVPGTDQYSHGLGAGDINGDGRQDVMVPGGWWEQPAKVGGEAWKFHAANLGAPCADMFAMDLDGDGKADVISSSAHNYGIWSYLQKGSKGEEPTFLKQDLFPKLFSQSHAMHLVDVNGDGLKDLVTGKRWWAHGPTGDVDANHPAVLVWFEARKSADGIVTFTPHQIDDDSGIGTQFVVADFNGDKRPDIVISNKKGVFLFEQTGGK